MCASSKELPHFATHDCIIFRKVCASAAILSATGCSYSADIIGCHQVMEMAVISSTLSALLSETICSVYRGRHKQTVFLLVPFPNRRAARVCHSQRGGETAGLPRKRTERERIGMHGGMRESQKDKRGGRERGALSLNWESITEA